MRAVLGALGIDASTEESVGVALREHVDSAWRRMLPPVLVTRSGETPTFPVHVRPESLGTGRAGAYRPT